MLAVESRSSMKITIVRGKAPLSTTDKSFRLATLLEMFPAVDFSTVDNLFKQCNYDVAKTSEAVLESLLLIELSKKAEAEKKKLVKKQQPQPKTEKFITVTKDKKTRSKSFSAPARTSTELKSNLTQSELKAQGLRSAAASNIIDLHQFQVVTAEQTVRGALPKWWSTEFAEREYTCQSSCTTFTIITGQGIHSQNGVPKIRNSIRVLLEQGGWRFTSSSGRFTVLGKK